MTQAKVAAARLVKDGTLVETAVTEGSLSALEWVLQTCVAVGDP